MADKGIIFSAPMVRALLDGRKSQTRRLAKLPEQPSTYLGMNGQGDHVFTATERWGGQYCAPYAPGDRLYVREAFSYDRLDVDRDGTLPPWYWADGNPSYRDWSKPKPSIHMPRWASRLWLEVTDVRVQRLQEISEADAIAEGIEQHGRFFGLPDGDWDDAELSAVAAYAWLWNTLHTAPGTRWEDNPWIVAVSFTTHHGNIDGGGNA